MGLPPSLIQHGFEVLRLQNLLGTHPIDSGQEIKEICHRQLASSSIMALTAASNLVTLVYVTNQDQRRIANPASKNPAMDKDTMKKLLVLIFLVSPFSFVHAEQLLDKVLIRSDALEVRKISFPENNGRQINYKLSLEYPITALMDENFQQLKKLGWSRCSGYHKGWENYVDSSKGDGLERSVFQNNIYWFKSGTLLTISMRYYAGVTKNKQCLEVPDNTQQHVVVLENSAKGIKEKLGITCP